MKYYYNQQGEVTLKGSNGIVNDSDDEFVINNDDEINNTQMKNLLVDVETKEIKKVSDLPIKRRSDANNIPEYEVTPTKTRRIEYSSFNNQLDLLYHDIEDGVFGDEAKLGKWFKHIKKVKRNNPIKE